MKKMFSAEVNTIIGSMGFRLLIISDKCSFDAAYAMNTSTTHESNAGTFAAENSITTYTNVRLSFIRGSALCSTDFPGKYCPMVMSLSIVAPYSIK
jgi:hypothetical protein